MKEEIEKRRAEAAEKKKQKEESSKPTFAISPKGSSKVNTYSTVPTVNTTLNCNCGVLG